MVVSMWCLYVLQGAEAEAGVETAEPFTPEAEDRPDIASPSTPTTPVPPPPSKVERCEVRRERFHLP